MISAFILNLTITTWHWIHHIQKVDSRVKDVFVTVEIESIDERIQWTNSQTTRRVKITKDTTYEKSTLDNTNVQLAFQAVEDRFGISDQDTNEPKPMHLKVKGHFEVNDCPQGTSLIQCPMLSPYVQGSRYELHPKIDLQTGCQKKDACQCDLQFKLMPTSQSREIIVGQQKTAKLRFEVHNRWTEPSYGAKIVFWSRLDFTSIQGLHGNCVKLESRVEVSMTNFA